MQTELFTVGTSSRPRRKRLGPFVHKPEAFFTEEYQCSVSSFLTPSAAVNVALSPTLQEQPFTLTN